MRLFRHVLLPAATIALLLWVGCDNTGVEPSDDVPILSNPQTLFDERDERFYAAVTVTLPAAGASPDSIWAELYLSSGELADSLGTDSVWYQTTLNDTAANGDILPQDDVYACKFDSPLPQGTGGSVRFEFYAIATGDTSNVTDSLSLANLRPVILSVSASDSLALPPPPSPHEYYTLDTLRATAADPDGLEDIKRVSFTILKPDSTLSNNGQPFSLADNGELDLWGDIQANDGIYSIIITLESTNDTGRYVYRFTAQDYNGGVSDTFRHTVIVQ